MMSAVTRGRRGGKKEALGPTRREEKLRVTSECARQARQRAQQIFLSMIEGPVEPQTFIAKARYINPDVYSDVVVERAVTGLCGYPMCHDTFTDIYSSQTYIIRSNRLYDITERRNFCSNVCFEASELVRKQILTLPLYLRDSQDADMRDVRLPCLATLNGRHGRLIDVTGGMSTVQDEEDEERERRNKRVNFKTVDDIARESLVNWSENEADNKGTEGDGVVSDKSGEISPENVVSDKSVEISPENEDLNKERLHIDKTKYLLSIDNKNENRTVEINNKMEKLQIENTAIDIGRVSIDETKTVLDNKRLVDDKTNANQKEENEELDRRKTVESGINRRETNPSTLCTQNSDVQSDGSGAAMAEDSTENRVITDEETKQRSTEREKKSAVDNPLSDVLKVESMVREWISFDSLRVILGDHYVRGMIEHLGHSWDTLDTTSGMRLSVEAKARYVAICRRLDHEERLEQLDDTEQDLEAGQHRQPNKPLPNYSQLQQQAKKQQLKVVSFYGGSDHYEEPEEGALETVPEEETEGSGSKAKSKESRSKSNKKVAPDRQPTLPFVDSYSQLSWRQSIVIEKVTAYLQQLLTMTGFSVHEVKKLLTPLIATFNLSPHNISFRPRQWRLIALILLKMLSVRYPGIKTTLSSVHGTELQRTVLSTFTLDLGYCDRVLAYLTQIHHVLTKDFEDHNND